MLNYNRIVLAFFIVFVSSSLLFAGGPWPQAKGKGYFKLYEWWIIFDQHFTDSGNLDPNVTTGIFNTSVYAEYGLSNRVTAILNAPVLSRNYMNNLVSATTEQVLVAGEGINTIGDIDLGVKYALTKPGAKYPIAATLILGLPTGKTNGGEQGNLQTGDGEFNQLLQVDVGTSYALGKKSSIYFSANLGFNNRTNEFSDEIRYGLEAGLGLAKSRLWLIARLNAIESLKNGATAATATSTSIFANNTEFTSIGFEANYYITKKFGVSAGFATATRGEIIAAAPSYSVGFFYDMNR